MVSQLGRALARYKQKLEEMLAQLHTEVERWWTPNPCPTYCAAPDACGWTKEYSCPWAAKPGSAGRAGDDGSAGYECCCVDRTAASQHCGGNGTRSDTGSLQFTGFLTPAGETVLQVLNPTDADTLKFSVADEGRGFEFSLAPGLATFVWR